MKGNCPMIASYVFCEDHKCSVKEWELYRWHLDRGCHLSWNGRPADASS